MKTKGFKPCKTTAPPGLPALLRQLREERGYTQEGVALLAGVPRNRINHYERGIMQPDDITLRKLAVLFCVDVVELERARKDTPATKPEQQAALSELGIGTPGPAEKESEDKGSNTPIANHAAQLRAAHGISEKINRSLGDLTRAVLIAGAAVASQGSAAEPLVEILSDMFKLFKKESLFKDREPEEKESA